MIRHCTVSTAAGHQSIRSDDAAFSFEDLKPCSTIEWPGYSGEIIAVVSAGVAGVYPVPNESVTGEVAIIRRDARQ